VDILKFMTVELLGILIPTRAVSLVEIILILISIVGALRQVIPTS